MMKPSTLLFRRMSVCSMLCLLLSIFPLMASETASDCQLPADFQRVTRLSELSSGDFVILAGMTEIDGRGDVFSFMSNRFLSDNPKKMKLKGYTHDKGLEENFTCGKAEVVWRYQRNGDGSCALQSVASDEFLACKSESALGLMLNKNASSANTKWYISPKEDGTFLISASKNGNRALTANDYQGYKFAVFDHYVSSQGLYLYKMAGRTESGSGDAVVPANGAIVAITAGSTVGLANGKGETNLSAFLLANDKLTEDAPVSKYKTTTAGGAADGAFYLIEQESGKYLQEDLALQDVPCPWVVENGKLGCRTAQDALRTLCFDASEKRWRMCLDDELETLSSVLFPQFRAIEDGPKYTLSGNGTLVLKGGWSGQKLSEINWKNVKCLDLTSISLPLEVLPFKHSSETHNLPIFVSGEMANLTAKDWLFVVKCENGVNTLLRKTTLTDREPFFTDREIQVGSSQMDYTRQFVHPEGWQTICLPFSVSKIPYNVLVVELTTADDASAECAEVPMMEAGEAYLVRLRDTTGDPQNVTFMSGASVLSAHPDGNVLLNGTFQPLTWTTTPQGAFLLRQNPACFMGIPAGSCLPPFRAYLKRGTGNQAGKNGILLNCKTNK